MRLGVGGNVLGEFLCGERCGALVGADLRFRALGHGAVGRFCEFVCPLLRIDDPRRGVGGRGARRERPARGRGDE